MFTFPINWLSTIDCCAEWHERHKSFYFITHEKFAYKYHHLRLPSFTTSYVCTSMFVLFAVMISETFFELQNASVTKQQHEKQVLNNDKFKEIHWSSKICFKKWTEKVKQTKSNRFLFRNYYLQPWSVFVAVNHRAHITQSNAREFSSTETSTAHIQIFSPTQTWHK